MKRVAIRTAVAIAALIILNGLGRGIAAQKTSKPINVGMVALLASPEKYDGKEISTWGFLHIGRMPEDDGLWLHKEDGDFALYKNSLALELSPEQRQSYGCVNHTYVMITGRMRSDGPDTSALNSGAIQSVTDVIGWSPHRLLPCEASK